jgi:hypothetical protein
MLQNAWGEGNHSDGVTHNVRDHVVNHHHPCPDRLTLVERHAKSSSSTAGCFAYAIELHQANPDDVSTDRRLDLPRLSLSSPDHPCGCQVASGLAMTSCPSSEHDAVIWTQMMLC